MMYFIFSYTWLFGMAVWCWCSVVLIDGRTVITIESSSSEEHAPQRYKRYSCTDHMKNQDETDVDCGGLKCPKCENMKFCRINCDCLSNLCSNNKCVLSESCTDHIKNQDETDVDCGGRICSKCNNTQTCHLADDCISGVCNNNTCAPSESCTDHIKNQDETDVDCGGRICSKCNNTQTCRLADDCISGVCKNYMCIPPPSCFDDTTNQDETDVDCGGYTCQKCMNGKICNQPYDCLSDVCKNNTCAPSESCTDHIKNQDETDVDCGGHTCPQCNDTKTCNQSSDCISNICNNNTCAPAGSCFDNIKNQDETDVDCGGYFCSKCTDGKVCNISSDCDSNQCGANVCQRCSLDSFSNGGFESGNANGWTIGGGVRTTISSSDIQPEFFLPNGPLYSASTAGSHSAVVTNGQDPILSTLMPNIVQSGQYAFRIEDLIKGGYASVISRPITNYFCLDIYFAWLAVVENGNHISNESSIMIVQLNDTTTGDTLISRRYDAGAGSGGVDNRFKQKNAYFYTPSWQIEHLAIGNDRIGHNFTLTVLAADCKPAGHVGYAYIDSFSGIAPALNVTK